ncbi:MAG: methyltransferase domain-containing protein [Pseudonocardiaceae bacterium]
MEIGTGTGYNAALLAHRLGAGNVASIEIDPQVAQQARANLAKADAPLARSRPYRGHGWNRSDPAV